MSLGVLTTLGELAAMAAAVALTTALGWGLNILFGTRPSRDNVSP